MSELLEIGEAEKLLSEAWGKPVEIRTDFSGYYTKGPDGGWFCFYDHATARGILLEPVTGDWPAVEDLTDCPIPAENDRADAAQRHYEQRGG